MNVEKLKITALKHEKREDWRKAIDLYLRVIESFESGVTIAQDLSVYNRVGDLYMKVKNTTSAVQSYERAVDLYADQGMTNQAIALCGKVLRVNPGRVQTYLKLARLHAEKNVVVDARKNLLEYLERMNALEWSDSTLPEELQGWSTIHVTNGHANHPYAAAWWPVAHVLGYEHSFVNQAADIMNVLGGGEPVVPLPDFADAYKVQRVLAAVTESDKNHCPVKLSEIG